MAAPMIAEERTYDYDYLVIGSGFGGSVSALRLSEKGYRVLVLEKGKRLTEKDFPTRNWNLRKWLWVPMLRFFGFFRITLFRHLTVLSGVGVGGGSLVYANALQVPAERVLPLRELGRPRGLGAGAQRALRDRAQNTGRDAQSPP